MDLDETLKICSMCLPTIPDTILMEIAEKMMESEDTLFIKSANAAIDLRLRDPGLKTEIMNMFLRRPILTLDCPFLRQHIDLYIDIVAVQVKRVEEKDATLFEVQVDKNIMQVFIGQETRPIKIEGRCFLDRPMRLVEAACFREYHNILVDFDGTNGMSKGGSTELIDLYHEFCEAMLKSAATLYHKDDTVVRNPRRFSSVLALISHYHPL